MNNFKKHFDLKFLSGDDVELANFGDDFPLAGASNSEERQRLTDGSDDRFEVRRGDNTVFGTEGYDTVAYQQSSTELHVSIDRSGGVKVHDVARGDTDTLIGIEAVKFADVSLELSVGTPGQMRDVGLLYQVLFDRAAGVAGLTEWTSQPLEGLELIKKFMSTTAFEAGIGALNDHDFVLTLFRNVGFDSPDPQSVQSWESYLDQHSRVELVGSWIADKALTAPLFGEHGLWLT